MNSHVDYVHTKPMIIDPLTEDPLIVTGSGNWSLTDFSVAEGSS